MTPVTILLPVHNSAGTHPATLASAAQQTHAEYQLLAIDDGSSDETGQILDAAAATDSRVEVHHRPHRGLVATLNYGFELAASPWITRIDADDLMRPTRIARQLALAAADPDLGLIATQAHYLGDRAANQGMAQFVDWTNQLLTHEQIAEYQFVESPFIHPTVMFRRELAERHGTYREGEFPEDYELWLRWLEAGAKMAKIPEPLLDWRERPTRLTRTGDRYSVDAFHRVKAPYLYRWLERNNPHHPNVTVWGAGRITRQRLRWLIGEGLQIKTYVDIDPKKIGQTIEGIPVIGPDELPSPGATFVLTCVSSRGARSLIEAQLRSKRYRPQINYLCAA